MSGIVDIEQLFHPKLVKRLDATPVSCKIWKKEGKYEDIVLDSIYPFDTLETIKQTISRYYKDDTNFLPNFLFVAERTEEGFQPLEYTWYPIGTQKADRVIYLPSPTEAMQAPVKAFVSRGGGRPATSLNPRGRMMIEGTFESEIPTLYVFPFHRILRLYEGETNPISEADWWSRFYPYYPNLNPANPTALTKEDKAFAKIFLAYLDKRSDYLKKINKLLASPLECNIRVTGVKQLRLMIQKASKAFEDCQTLFYAKKVNKLIPYMRILPVEGTPITKVLVSGALPIPDLDNPEVIAQWAKETTPSMGHDLLMLKYVHREAMGTQCPVYGTIRIFHDGTADILIQPPTSERKLEPATDFRDFGSILQTIGKELPLSIGRLEIGEAAMIFQLNAEHTRFTKTQLRDRLRFFSPFFQEITPLKDRPSLISLRYKAVSQYASENNMFSFLTQLSESKKLDGMELSADTISKLQDAFQISELDARTVIIQWLERGGTLSVVVPEENEFMEAFNPGIDIHIYGPHPEYTVHVHRIDSYLTLQRLYSLLCLFFMDEAKAQFKGTKEDADEYSALESAVESQELEEEETERGEDEDEANTASGAYGLQFGRYDEDEDEDKDEDESGEKKEEEKKEKVVTKKQPRKRYEEETDSINPKGWFLKQLEDQDPILFPREQIKGKTADKGPTKSYARQCGATDDKQPVALTEAQYKFMLKTYEKEINAGDLYFNTYPLQKTEKEKMPGDKIPGHGRILGTATEITISRYGSSKDNIRYYFCPNLFCLRDKIMILEEDFSDENDRSGKFKGVATCPFCGGKEIRNRNKAESNRTILRRKGNKTSNKPHLFIGFLKKDKSDVDKMQLPCCYALHQTLRITDSAFERLKSLQVRSDRGTFLDTEVVDEMDASADADARAKERAKTIKKSASAPIRPTINYAIIFGDIDKAYILEENKHPLEPGKLALLPPLFNDYFQQDYSKLVKRIGSQQKLQANSRGFLRIGPEIGPLSAKCDTPSKPTESLFGVLAQLLYKNSIEEVRDLFLNAIDGPSGVRTFVNANFGNLVNEFYMPSDPDYVSEAEPENVSDNADPDFIELYRSWGDKHLGISVNDSNIYAVRRIYKSWTRFREEFLESKTARKDLRHLTSFLSEPNLLSTNRRGLQIIILEWTPGQETISVQCNTYGFSRARHEENDVAFVWRDQNGYYELLVYTENIAGRGAEEHNTITRWKYRDRAEWPRIIKDRVNEWMSKCQSKYYSIFTSQMGVDSNALIPLSKALTTPITVPYKEKSYEVLPYGIVRDSYNHAVFVVYPLKPKNPDSDTPMIAMPIVDDGYMPTTQQLYLDIEDDSLTYAPADAVVNYYNTYLVPAFASYSGYKVKSIVRRRKKDNPAKGIQLMNSIYVPASEAKDESFLSAYPNVNRLIDEWAINRDIASQPCEADTIIDRPQKRLEELYQYFRFSVSNWIATDAGREFRKSVEKLIFDDTLPEYEKRKRLEILSGHFGWTGWMEPTDEEWDMPMGLLRKDCRAILREDKCNAPCMWTEEGGCLLHVDEETEIRSVGEPKKVNTRQLFIRRVIDELIRFPRKRKEILRGQVSKMGAILHPIREGNQYIIPERGMDWLALLRLDWRPPEKEVPLHYEEMARNETDTTGTASGDLPEELKELVGSKTTYQLWFAKGGLKGLSSILGADWTSTEPSESAVQDYVKRTNIPMGIIDLREDPVALRFIRGSGDPTETIIIVFMKKNVALLIDKEGKPKVSVANLDGDIKDAWDSAVKVVETKGTVLRRRDPAIKVVKTEVLAPPEPPKESVKEIPKSPIREITVAPAPVKKTQRRVKFALPSLSVSKESEPPSQKAVTVKEESVVAPPPEELVVAPLPVESVAAPILEESVVAPPPEELVVAPPPEELVVAPPPVESVVAPPPEELVVAPLPVESVVAPPPVKSVVAPIPEESAIVPLLPEESIPAESVTAVGSTSKFSGSTRSSRFSKQSSEPAAVVPLSSTTGVAPKPMIAPTSGAEVVASKSLIAPTSGAEVVPKSLTVPKFLIAPKSGAEVVVAPPPKSKSSVVASLKPLKKLSALDSDSNSNSNSNSNESVEAPKSKSQTQKTIQKAPSIFEPSVKPPASVPKSAAKSAKSTNAKKRAEALLSML
jgi:hypothetical protein